MKNILTIIKKEFSRFFKDRRMVLSILLPGIMIYLVYSLMGTAMEAMMDTADEGYTPTARVLYAPEGLEDTFNQIFVLQENLTEDEAKEKITSGDLDVLIVFPDNFNAGAAQDVHIYYDSSRDTSYTSYNMALAVLDMLKPPSFTVNADINETFNLAKKEDISRQMLSMMIPMIIFAFLASAGMAVAPESIAGEKERGTMATMLITPIKRWQLALGKIISLACFALLSGISSFLGVILSLPKLTAGLVDADMAILFGFGDYMALFGVIISIVLVIIALFSVVSCYAKSVKESGSLIAPFMIVIILLGVASMVVSGTPSTALFLIPLMGSGLAMSGIMTQSVSALQILLSIGSNIVVAALLIVLLAVMFNSERIMFKR